MFFNHHSETFVSQLVDFGPHAARYFPDSMCILRTGFSNYDEFTVQAINSTSIFNYSLPYNRCVKKSVTTCDISQ